MIHDAAGSHDLLARKAHQIAPLGIARSFQNLELFAELSVFDNVLIARSIAMRAICGYSARTCAANACNCCAPQPERKWYDAHRFL